MSKKLLIVDDDVTMRRLLKSILVRQRYHCTIAADTSQARSIVEHNQFDLILCEVHIPGESGLDFIRFLATEHPDVAVIIVTVDHDPDTAGEALEIGVCGYIIKPFNRYQVLIQVAIALRQQQPEIKAQANQAQMEETIYRQAQELSLLKQKIKEKEAAMHELNSEVDNVRNALHILIEQREKLKQQSEENILANVKNTIIPYIEKFKRRHLDPDQLNIVAIVEEKLNTLVAPMVKLLSSQHFGLTPAELLVADLIKHGKQTKEIAEILNLSQNTIITHRYHIRRKLGLMNTKTNLRTYLISLE